MANNGILQHIEQSVETVIDTFQEKIREKDICQKIKSEIIFLYRLRKNPQKEFYFFCSRLDYIAKINPNFSFFNEFYCFLKNHYHVDPWKRLSWFLDSNIESQKSRESLILTKKELYLSSILPNNQHFLSIAVFFLYDHNAVYQFFYKNPEVFLSEKEKKLLSNFRCLPEALQHRVSAYIKKLNDDTE